MKFEVKSRNCEVRTVMCDVTTGLSYELICYNFTVNHLLRIEFSDKHIIFLSLTVIWKSLKKNDRQSFISYLFQHYTEFTERLKNIYSRKPHFYFKKQNIRAGNDMLLADSHILKCYNVA